MTTDTYGVYCSRVDNKIKVVAFRYDGSDCLPEGVNWERTSLNSIIIYCSRGDLPVNTGHWVVYYDKYYTMETLPHELFTRKYILDRLVCPQGASIAYQAKFSWAAAFRYEDEDSLPEWFLKGKNKTWYYTCEDSGNIELFYSVMLKRKAKPGDWIVKDRRGGAFIVAHEEFINIFSDAFFTPGEVVPEDGDGK